MCKPQIMSTIDKYWYIKEHWDEYEKHLNEHDGQAMGFPFPDGTRIGKNDEDLEVF